MGVWVNVDMWWKSGGNFSDMKLECDVYAVTPLTICIWIYFGLVSQTSVGLRNLNRKKLLDLDLG